MYIRMGVYTSDKITLIMLLTPQSRQDGIGSGFRAIQPTLCVQKATKTRLRHLTTLGLQISSPPHNYNTRMCDQKSN